MDIVGSSIVFGAENTLTVTLPEELEGGSYELTFKLGGKDFKVSFEIAE